MRLNLDKFAHRSDWNGRPLDTRQLYYATLDAFATLLLYENQIGRNLRSDYRLRKNVSSGQVLIPLDEFPEPETVLAVQLNPVEKKESATESSSEFEPTNLSIALLGIVTELPTRYSPDSLTVSLGSDRVGLAGWIIDQHLGRDVDLDEETVKLTIANLCERELLQITETRRLEATENGMQIWQNSKYG